ncbi:VOC family protein [Pseudoalteromonas sp. B193]
MAVSAIPKGFHSVTPYLIMNDAQKAIDFYCDAFSAEHVMQMPLPDGGIAHAEIIGDSHIMLSDNGSEEHLKTQKNSVVQLSLMLYVEDVDTVFKKAIELGATEIRPVHDQFYGDRTGTLQDPFGHIWIIGSHKEDVSDEELNNRIGNITNQEQDA